MHVIDPVIQQKLEKIDPSNKLWALETQFSGVVRWSCHGWESGFHERIRGSKFF